MARVADPELRRWWKELIGGFDPRRSTVLEFCRRNKVSVASFYKWRRKLKGEPDEPQGVTEPDEPQGVAGGTGGGFLPVRVVPPREEAIVSVHLHETLRVDLPVTQPELLLKLVDHVRPSGKEAAS